MRETGETTEDRMSSAAETRNANHEIADVATTTAVTAASQGQPHRGGSEAGTGAGSAGTAGDAGIGAGTGTGGLRRRGGWIPN